MFLSYMVGVVMGVAGRTSDPSEASIVEFNKTPIRHISEAYKG
jgi:hypothetical protein